MLNLEDGLPRVLTGLGERLLAAATRAGCFPREMYIAMAQIMFHSNWEVVHGDRSGFVLHKDSACWPPGGVMVVYLFATEPGLTVRCVTFGECGRKVHQIGFIHKLGGAYSMGEKVLARDNEDGLGHASLSVIPQNGHIWTILYRVAPV
jgi:hypothetical protein